jgi:triosephosphate isomerase
MNLGPQDARAFLTTFLPDCTPAADRRLLFFPSAVSVAAVRECVAGRADIGVGVQNIYWEDKGAFTGEISAPMASQAGATYVLVGHSERRHVFGETDADTARKCAAAVRAGLTPVLCVGEKLEERERGETYSVVGRQLRAGLQHLTPEQIAAVLVAYEPVWAIGTGKTATPEDASAGHERLRKILRELARGADIPVLYGGSVTPDNVAALIAAPAVDGVLVGGASLDPAKWAAIVSA